MAIPRNIKQYLFHRFAVYSHKTHPVAFTSQEIAEVDHVPGKQFAKTVILKTGEKLIMAVVPGDHIISIDTLQEKIGCEHLALATEKEFIERFPSCQPGAMPPFGRLFDMPLYCDNALAKQSEIEFNAGTHVDTIRMNFANFNELESPVLLNFSEKRTGPPIARSA
jgi:Ala-tRNA(Pro) deacylase